MPRITTRRMQLNDIDAAGIAFTGRLVTIAMEVLEEGLAKAGLDFATMIREGRYGVPMVHIEADFKRPFRHGDLVDVDLWCDAIGDRSYTCRIELLPAGTRAVSTSLHFTAAVIDMATFKSVAVPEAFRAALTTLIPPQAG
jgi:acyl-CoA thioesterase FadM